MTQQLAAINLGLHHIRIDMSYFTPEVTGSLVLGIGLDAYTVTPDDPTTKYFRHKMQEYVIKFGVLIIIMYCSNSSSQQSGIYLRPKKNITSSITFGVCYKSGKMVVLSM